MSDNDEAYKFLRMAGIHLELSEHNTASRLEVVSRGKAIIRILGGSTEEVAEIFYGHLRRSVLQQELLEQVLYDDLPIADALQRYHELM